MGKKNGSKNQSIIVINDDSNEKWQWYDYKFPRFGSYKITSLSPKISKNWLRFIYLIYTSDIVVIRGFSIWFLLLPILRPLNHRNVAIEIGFSDWDNSIYRRVLKKSVHLVVNKYALIHVFTSNLKDFLRDEFQYRNKVFIYGITFSYRGYSNIDKIEKSNKIIAAGRVGRDFSEIEYKARNSRFNYKIIGCDGKDTSNLEFLYKLPLDEFIKELKSAKLIIIPVIDSKLPSGIRMLWMAIELGVPVIIRKSRGNSTYLDDHSYREILEYNSDVDNWDEMLMEKLNYYKMNNMLHYNRAYVKENFDKEKLCNDLETEIINL